MGCWRPNLIRHTSLITAEHASAPLGTPRPADGRHQVVQAVGLSDPRPPRELHHQGRGGHHWYAAQPTCTVSRHQRRSSSALAAHGRQGGASHSPAHRFPCAQAPWAPASAMPSVWPSLRLTLPLASTSPMLPRSSTTTRESKGFCRDLASISHGAASHGSAASRCP